MIINHKQTRIRIREYTNDIHTIITLLRRIGINVTKDGFIKVRAGEKNASCLINKNGSFHDYGSGQHYSDLVSLLFDGYNAFDSLPETMEWLCEELNINMEAYDE